MRTGRRRQSLVTVLKRRIQACELRNPTAHQLVDYLCTNYPDYNRSSRRWLLKQAVNILRESQCRKSSSINSSNVSDLDSAAEEVSDGLKRGELDGNEDMLQPLMNRRRSFGSESENEVSDQVEEEEDEFHAAGDVNYGEHYEPEIDLMKSQLREGYIASSKVRKPKMIKEKVDLTRNGAGKRKLKEDLVRKAGNGGGSGKRPRFKDCAGMSHVLKMLEDEVIVPFSHPYLRRRPITGILLHGPPGCGKTMLARAIANETGVPFYQVSAAELVSGISGGSEENIRELFSKAKRTAPSIVLIDEIDAIASERESIQRAMEVRIVSQLLTCMDETYNLGESADTETGLEKSDSNRGYVLVIGATNRPDAVDSALRRPGRFEHEILLDVPNETARAEILLALTRNLGIECAALDLSKIARATPGFVGADLAAVANKAHRLPMKRMIAKRRKEFSVGHVDGAHADPWWKPRWSSEEMEQLDPTMADFENAVGMVQPSSKREGFYAIPSVKWEDVGGLQQVRKAFERSVIRRIKYPDRYKAFGIKQNVGILLYGPPGCGKTLIAQAVANEAGANFIYIKGPELLSKYVGESELEVRKLFKRARTCAPCIVFFDEVDSLTINRGKEGGSVGDRVVNQLLTELADERRGVYVIGATNRPEVVDPALLRPDRFGQRIYVSLPTAHERGLILTALARNMPIDPSVDLMAIGSDSACENLSGADLSDMMTEAATAAIDETFASERMTDHTEWTEERHIKQALMTTTPSVSETQRQHYQLLSHSLKAA